MPTTKEETNSAPQELVVGCSFCGKSQSQVKKLVAGPGVYICDECLGLCNTILEVEGWEAPRASAEQVVNVLKTMDVRDKTTSSWAALCRRLGVSWEHIGEAVGLSGAEAQRRLTVED